MANEADRILKIEKCISVKFCAKDKDGDMVFIDIDGEAAQQLLDYVQRGLVRRSSDKERLILA